MDLAPDTKQQILSTSLLDARDALDLIAVAGSRENVGKDDLKQGPSATSHQFTGVRPATKSWDRFFLVKRGIIRPHEAVEYLDFYFSQLWHLFPVIPEYYSSSDHYGSLVAEEPVLTISLVTIASRYHALSGFNGKARSERIHWRTWPWVQRLFQSSMWGSSAMRSLGAIAALLLFIEWHPMAINSPEDLISDYGESELFDPQSQIPEAAEPTETYRRPGLSSIPERLNKVAPAYRSNKMSWMLLSTAISLAQEMGCLDEEQVLGHADSSLARDSIRLEWIHILSTFVRLTDESLALRLRLEPHLANGSWMEVIDHLPSSFMVDGVLESTVDLATHMRKARELLRSWRRHHQGSGPAVPITAWESFRRGLDRWGKHRQFSRTDLSLRGACLDIEYYYVRLCGFSPAAHMFERSPETHPGDIYVESLSQFAEEATEASVNMLELAIQCFTLPKPFTYAAATLKTEEQLDSTNPYIGLIMKVVDATRQGAPDDIHMSQRYATLLDILIKAALRTSSASISRSSYSNTVLTGTSLMESNDLDLGDDLIYGIYDSNFWDTLPDMVRLYSVPNSIMSSFE
ncbi:hypothetical protein TCE0_034r10244 [Talaromyces pinophilus]|uniref:Transcription factor domain-containing protein n=1 Tax=Talaromyces pinophilus TaxID=128442 RepID=A0A6V8HCM5_TALPI|nr:hypothetical protein TCE0_034r10244 [Talaromyces pinophilus]